MKIRNTLFSIILIIPLNGCVSSSEYESLKDKFDSLEVEHSKLKIEHNELKLIFESQEPAILLKEAKELMGKWWWFEAEQRLTLLINKFPDTPQAKEAEKLIKTIEVQLKNKPEQKEKVNPSNHDKPNQSLAFGKISDWKKASESEKLRICKGFADAFNKMSTLKIAAIDIKNCVDTATKGLDSTNEVKIQDLVILCMDEILKIN